MEKQIFRCSKFFYGLIYLERFCNLMSSILAILPTSAVFYCGFRLQKTEVFKIATISTDVVLAAVNQ